VDSVLLGASVLLAAVFATAGVGKLMDLPGARRALGEFGVPDALARPGAVVLPLAELAVAVGLLVVPAARWAAGAAALLLLAFVLGIANAMRQGRAPDCHCFGQIHSAPAGSTTLVRNAVLLGLSLFLTVLGPPPAIDGWIADRTPLELALAAAALVAVGLGAIRGLGWLERRDQAREEVLGDEVRQADLRPRGRAPGTPAPPFVARHLDGRTVSLDELRARGRPVVLVFTSPGCPSCRVLMPRLAEWQVTLAERLTIVPVGDRGEEYHRDLAEQTGIRDVLLEQLPGGVRNAYEAGGTPSAVVVDPDGTIGGPTVGGPWGVEELIRVTLHRTDSLREPAGLA
jgi:uncharacterized membrane protein YphA (DoxX/SURF4 family)/peroxiredoxin